MQSNETKHVQTELSEDEYDRFREFAREQGLSLKEAGHEAVVEWIERRRRPDPDDPAFTVLDELEDGSLPGSADTDASTEDDLVDDWHGEDASFRLADEPPTEPQRTDE